jgi:hypothetical protein
LDVASNSEKKQASQLKTKTKRWPKLMDNGDNYSLQQQEDRNDD